MRKLSTNKWSLERSRKSVNVLLKKAGMEPLLVEVLSDLLWVVDHQQDQLEQMYAWTKYIIEQALVDHARGDGTVQINETCHQAIKDWYYTEPVAVVAAQEAQESTVGSDAPLSDKALTDATANIELVISIAELYDARGAEAASLGLTAILDEMERLRGKLSEAYALLDAEHIQR